MAVSLNILLVEDEFMTRRMLKSKLKSLGHAVVGETDNTDDAVSILEAEHVDLAILDINLGEERKDGIWLGEYIRFNEQIPFVYLTAYETADIVDRALNTQPHAYLTKPFNDLSLRTTLAIAAQQCQLNRAKEEVRHLMVKNKNLLKQIPLADITFFESGGNYLLVHTNTGQYRYRGTISNILKNLPSDQFLQTHRAFIVNLNHVAAFNRTTITIGEHEIPISKGRVSDVIDKLKQDL